MKTICIQIQQDRGPVVDCDSIKTAIIGMGFSVKAQSFEKESFVNLTFGTSDPLAFWHKHSNELLALNGFPEASIVTCEGERSGDDYLLLHHYDRNERTHAVL